MKKTVTGVPVPISNRSASWDGINIDMILSSMSRRERRKTQRQLGLVSRRVDFTKKIDIIKKQLT